MHYVRPTYHSLLAEGMVLTNQAAFWRRNLHRRLGWLNESLHYGFDYDWFLRVLAATDCSEHIPALMGAMRYHADTKTSRYPQLFDAEYRQILAGRVLPHWREGWFRFRRMLLTLANGHVGYPEACYVEFLSVGKPDN